MYYKFESLFVALCIQHAMRMFHIVISGHSGSTMFFFSHYLINGKILEKKLLNIKYVFWFSPQFSSDTFLILGRNELHMMKNVDCSSWKINAFHFRFQWNLNILHRSSKNIQISYFMKIRPVGAKLFHAESRTDGHADGQMVKTDMMKVNTRCSQFFKHA